MGRHLGSKNKKHKAKKKSLLFKKYVSSRNKGDPLKIYFWEKRPMSRDGYERVPRRFKLGVKKIIFKPLMRVDVPETMINTKEGIEKLTVRLVGYEGRFQMRMFCKAKNRFGVSPKSRAEIEIRNTPDGLKGVIIKHKMHHYWFWNK